MSLGWQGLRGRKVGVWGVGVEGSATLRRLAAEGIEPVAVVDGPDTDALLACDVVVKSPGISPYDEPARALLAAGVELVGGLGIWLADAPADRVVCITGTKGKSTTTSIAGELVRGLGHSVLTGGNLGVVPWDPETPEADWYVVEVSSYQAHDLTTGPRVVVVTSLSQDHLSWHHGYENYVADKLSLCTRPGVEVVVAPSDDPELDRFADLLGAHVDSVEPDLDQAWLQQLGVLGEHNLRNALLARRALVRLGVPGAEDDDAIAAAARAYRPLRSRLTSLGSVGGVEFVDDSLATNTLPTLAAVRAFDGRRVALLLGGHDRGIDYTPLAAGLADRADLLVLTLPDNGPRIAEAFARVAPAVDVRECGGLEEAVRIGYGWAREGRDGVVLLSPAAPSFGVFKDYAERAEVFEAAMRSLG